jgi:hypothetical protein
LLSCLEPTRAMYTMQTNKSRVTPLLTRIHK